MKVIEHKPGAWYLLIQGEDLYIDVNCSRSFVDFSVAVQLNESEKVIYSQQGYEFIENLSQIIARKSAASLPQNIKDKKVLSNIHEAIIQWKQEQK